MRPHTFVLGLALAFAVPAEAQHAGLGVQGALGDYREQTAALRFRGEGGGAWAEVGVGPVTLAGVVVRLEMEPGAGSPTGAEAFRLTQLDARMRVRLVGFLSAEAGVLYRWIDPERAAQEVGAFRVGVHASQRLAPGAVIEGRAAWLGGAKFSAGGRAPVGVEVGLGASYGLARWLQVTGQYDFHRLDRRTDAPGGRQEVPIQMSVARVGLGLRL